MPRKKNTPAKLAKQMVQRAKKMPVPEVEPVFYLPTGSALLNLAISDLVNGGYGAGKVGNLVGDSNTGKTLLAMSGLMEMSLDPRFDDYDLIYDDAESALEMDVEKMFGPRLAERLLDPYGTSYGDPEWSSSNTLEETRNIIWNLLKRGKPFFYVTDSYDALTSREEIGRQDKEADGKEQKSDYPRGPKILSETLRKMKQKLKKSLSFWLVISQTRDSMSPVSFAAQKTRSGGKALRFYSSHEIWLALYGAIKQEVKSRKYTIGHHVVAKSARSKLTGKCRTVEMDVFTHYGVDDLGSMIEWHLVAGKWSGSRKAINTRGLVGEPISKEQLITLLESHPSLVRKLKTETQRGWMAVEEQLSLHRPGRWSL